MVKGSPEPGNTQPLGRKLSPSACLYYPRDKTELSLQGPWACHPPIPLLPPHLLTLPAPGPLHLLFSQPRALSSRKTLYTCSHPHLSRLAFILLSLPHSLQYRKHGFPEFSAHLPHSD